MCHQAQRVMVDVSSGRILPSCPHKNGGICSNITLISSPSRTADIEQSLTLGIHGPKELHVEIVG